jgi:hypothetical protein
MTPVTTKYLKGEYAIYKLNDPHAIVVSQKLGFKLFTLPFLSIKCGWLDLLELSLQTI